MKEKGETAGKKFAGSKLGLRVLSFAAAVVYNEDEAVKVLFSFLRDEKKHVLSLVGAGGKTTLLYEWAGYFAQLGRKTAVSTTAHILQPPKNFAADLREARRLWQKASFAVCGEVEKDTGKLIAPAFLSQLAAEAEIVLLEADGAKGRPAKIPAPWEPVLLEESDAVIAVFGLDALDRPLQEVCFRYEVAQKNFGLAPAALLDTETAARLLLSPLGGRKNVGDRAFYIVLNKCDDEILKAKGEKLREALCALGMKKEAAALRGTLGDLYL